MSRRAVGSRAPWRILCGVVALLYLFILGPIVITAAVSFNSVNQSKFPPIGFSLRWWHEAMVARWLDPLLFSVQLGLATSVIATVIGMPVAFALVRYRFPGRQLIAALSLGPLALPALVTGIALLQFLQVGGLGFLFGWPTLLIGHVIICTPFTVRCIAIGLAAMPDHMERAAASLGAPPVGVFRRVTLPLAKSGIFAGAVFAFIHSFTDYSVSLFLSRPGAQPITVTILGFLEYGFAPTLAAVAVITLFVPMVLILIVQRFFRIGDFIYGDGKS